VRFPCRSTAFLLVFFCRLQWVICQKVTSTRKNQSDRIVDADNYITRSLSISIVTVIHRQRNGSNKQNVQRWVWINLKLRKNKTSICFQSRMLLSIGNLTANVSCNCIIIVIVTVVLPVRYRMSYRPILPYVAPFQRYCRFSARDSTPIPAEFWGFSRWTGPKWGIQFSELCIFFLSFNVKPQIHLIGSFLSDFTSCVSFSFAK